MTCHWLVATTVRTALFHSFVTDWHIQNNPVESGPCSRYIWLTKNIGTSTNFQSSDLKLFMIIESLRRDMYFSTSCGAKKKIVMGIEKVKIPTCLLQTIFFWQQFFVCHEGR